MRTIGRHWPKSAPRDDYARLCDYCGVKFRASQLTVDRNGLYACPYDVGPDRVPYVRPPHIENNDGTGPSGDNVVADDDLLVLL